MKKFSYAVLIALVLGSSGCAVKDYNYLEKNVGNNEVNATTNVITKVSDAEYNKEQMFEWKITKGDRIDIKAFNQSSSNGQLTQLLSNGGQAIAQNRYGDEGILVPANGEINLPLVGKVNLLGMTEEEASRTLTKNLKRYLKHPYVHVKILNQKLFVVGEVRNPGTVLVTNGTMSLFEALATRGDVTDYADRTQIKIIRGSMRNPEIREINLTDLNSIRYASLILRPNDIVYVQARDSKASMVGAQEKLPFWQLIGAILAPFNTAIVGYGVVTR